MHYDRILLSMDGSGDEKRVVDEAFRLTSFFNAKLAIIVVNDPGAGKAHMMMNTLPRVTEDDIAGNLDAYGYGEKIDQVDIVAKESASYAEAIARTSHDFDLLIMGHHPKSRLLAFLKDSTDERVADRIDCPVLLVPLATR
ncbi:MAG TPA: universal stress protein [Desulfosarcina sp.]|nr:universal stress protein [Desulfosarcina sp.]